MNVLSIVMPCHNRAYDLINVLNAYDNQTATASFELIAVDDGSIDATHQLLSSFQPTHYTLRVARLEKNRGPAAARNIGIELATAPLIMFVGDDIVPEPELIQGHLQAHCQYPEPHIAILGRIAWANDLPQNTLMIHIDGIGAQQFSYYYFHDNTEYDFRHFYTSNVSLKTDFLKTLDHWFDTDFPYPAFEDAELAYRLSERGLRIIYRATLLARHSPFANIIVG